MASLSDYRPAFSDVATEAILAMPKRLQRKAMDRIYTLARYPFIKSDYVLLDGTGRAIDHLSVDEFIITYWVDHAHKLVMIDEIEIV